jgi:2-polyprenyl-3-methyl-5-hydroxy-6-metoxy-1,4-benzoquinol methylase
LNKFLTYSDEQLKDFVEMPVEWWSRPYEYAFAAKYLVKNQNIVDAGCGIEHPFKWYAAKKVKKVIAIDMDERILKLKNNEPITKGDPLTLQMLSRKGDDKNIDFIHGSFTENKDIAGMDRVFCISVFEHMKPDEQKKAIENFFNMLKPGGMLVMTLDYPMAKPDIIYNMAKECGFDLDKAKYEADNELNICTRQYGNIKVFTLVATKPKIIEEKKEEKKVK